MEVVKFKLNGKVFTLSDKNGLYYSEDGNYAHYVEMLNDEVIEFGAKKEIQSKL